MKTKTSSFVKRLISSALLIPFGIFVIFSRWLNGFPFLLGLAVFILLVVFEIAQMMEKKGYDFRLWINSVAITLSFIIFYLYGLGSYNSTIFILLIFLLMTTFVLLLFFLEGTQKRYRNSYEVIGVSTFSFIYLGLFAPFMILLKMLNLPGWLLFLTMLTAWLTDAGGLIIGKWIGKHKIKSLASPNKTVEGYIGSYVFAIATGMIYYLAQQLFAIGTTLTIPQILILTTLIATASNLGDIGESTFKRWANVKDSGNLLPGHGGFFDMMDSVIASAPVAYIILKFIGY